MNYYHINRKEILQKAKEKYSKEKASEYYLQNKEVIKEMSKNRYKNLSEDVKGKIKEYQRKRYQQLIQHKKVALQNKWVLRLLNIRMSEEIIKFNNIRVNKKEFHKSKQPIDLDLINVDQIVVVSDKFKHSVDCFKYFIGYKEGEIVKPLSIILPQMSGYIKYFENGCKNMSFSIKDDDVLDKCNQTWNKIKREFNLKFHSMSVYDEKHIKAKVRELFNGVIKTNFLVDEIPKESIHYACIACIIIDFVISMEKKNYPQVYLGECKHKSRKIKMTKFINTELESESGSKSELESSTELEQS